MSGVPPVPVTAQPEISDELVELVAEAEYEHDEVSTHGGWYIPWAKVSKNTYWDYAGRARAGLKVASEWAKRVTPPQADATANIVNPARIVAAVANDNHTVFEIAAHLGVNHSSALLRTTLTQMVGDGFLVADDSETHRFTLPWETPGTADERDGATR